MKENRWHAEEIHETVESWVTGWEEQVFLKKGGSRTFYEMTGSPRISSFFVVLDGERVWGWAERLRCWQQIFMVLVSKVRELILPSGPPPPPATLDGITTGLNCGELFPDHTLEAFDCSQSVRHSCNLHSTPLIIW